MGNRPIPSVREKSKLVVELHRVFSQNKDSEKALAMQAYMKNLFPFLGIQAPLRLALSKPLFKANPPQNPQDFISTFWEIWEHKEREYQYSAILYWSMHKKFWIENFALELDAVLENKSWWDSVDTFCSTCIVPFFKQFPKQKAICLDRWETSSDKWKRRVCLIHQLSYKDETDRNYLSRLIHQNKSDQDFFIRKAIGWALRQYAKTNPDWVLKFVENTDLKPLSKSEALKNLK